MAQKSPLTVEEFEKKLREVMDFIYDVYLSSDGYVNLMTSAPMGAAFCDKNKELITETTILLMAFQIICKRYGFVYWYAVDDWVNHFKKVVLEYLTKKEE